MNKFKKFFHEYVSSRNIIKQNNVKSDSFYLVKQNLNEFNLAENLKSEKSEYDIVSSWHDINLAYYNNKPFHLMDLKNNKQSQVQVDLRLNYIVEIPNSESAKMEMNKYLKYSLIGGGVLLALIITVAVYKKNK